MKTPAELAEAINNLNCHQRGEGYGPVTEAQIRMVVEEAQKPREDLPEWPKFCFDAQLGKYFKLDDQIAFDHFMAHVGEAPIRCSQEQYDAAMKGANDPQ